MMSGAAPWPVIMLLDEQTLLQVGMGEGANAGLWEQCWGQGGCLLSSSATGEKRALRRSGAGETEDGGRWNAETDAAAKEDEEEEEEVDAGASRMVMRAAQTSAGAPPLPVPTPCSARHCWNCSEPDLDRCQACNQMLKGVHRFAGSALQGQKFEKWRLLRESRGQQQLEETVAASGDGEDA
jgi:hypothetical protein